MGSFYTAAHVYVRNFYPIDSFSPTIQNVFLINPYIFFIRYFRKVVIDGMIPSVWFHLLMAFDALFFLAIGAWIHKKYNHELLYYV